jgi:hypothetical protein
VTHNTNLYLWICEKFNTQIQARLYLILVLFFLWKLNFMKASKIKSVQNIKDLDPRAEIEISGTQYTDSQ